MVSVTGSMHMSKLQETVKDREACCAAAHGGHKESDTTEQQKCLTPAWVKSEQFFTPENDQIFTITHQENSA